MLSLVLIKTRAECANFYHENLPNRILNRFFFNLTLWKIRCRLKLKAQAVQKSNDIDTLDALQHTENPIFIAIDAQNPTMT